MRLLVLATLLLGQLSFAGVTVGGKASQVARPQGLAPTPVATNQVVVAPQKPRVRAFFGDMQHNRVTPSTSNSPMDISDEDENPPLKPFSSPFDRKNKANPWF